ncbi:hypothetical protein GCM10009001_28680 [Virgibacillus siamensis]|uniref:Uncharacterized protein n=1 Tax=Virgibacillus siamensis TaxID=480071 RepID=A0ABP3RKV4_9BACI
MGWQFFKFVDITAWFLGARCKPSELRQKSSEVGVQTSELRPKSSEVAGQMSELGAEM